jgi:hypothetical protein
MVEMEG